MRAKRYSADQIVDKLREAEKLQAQGLPSELTNRTGRGVSPSTSCSERPAWRSARSSAADSNAQLRRRRAPSHAGGSGHSSERGEVVAEAR